MSVQFTEKLLRILRRHQIDPLKEEVKIGNCPECGDPILACTVQYPDRVERGYHPMVILECPCGTGITDYRTTDEAKENWRKNPPKKV